MTTFVTVRPPAVFQRPAGQPLHTPGRGIFWLAALGAVDALYLCYVHLFENGSCIAGQACSSVLQSDYSRVLGIPLTACALGLFAAILLAASRRALGWVRLFAVAGSLPAPFLIYVQAAVLHAWCPFCLVATALLVMMAVLSIRGGRAWVDLTRAPSYLVAFALPVAILAACEHGLAARDARRTLAPVAPTAPAATIAGHRVPLDRVPEVWRLEWDAYRAKLRFVEREVLKREAAAESMTVDDLVRTNVDMKVQIPEADILSRLEEVRGAGGPPPTRDERMRIASSLAMERRPAVEAAYLEGLFEKYQVSTELVPPGPRELIPFNPRGGPVRGLEVATLEIVVFSDFSCPMCARVHEWIRKLDVPARVSFRHLPLGPPGPPAFAAAAAHEQGRFWEFADVLFKRGTDLDAAKLIECAAEAGLDLAKFRDALASDRPRAAVAADMEEARALGIQATPTLFLNGVHFVGVPDARLVRAILERDAAR